ncbi:unnamed protein product, partial [Meganyctiphanes norvegica]
MSELSVKDENAAIFVQGITFYNIADGNNDFEVNHDNDITNSVRPNESYYPGEVLYTSAYGTFEEPDKEEMGLNDEKIKIQEVEIQIKEEIEMYEDPIAITGKGFPAKHELTHKGKKCRYRDKAFSQKSNIRHQITHAHDKRYYCSQCDKAFSEKGVLTRHQRTHNGEKPYHCSQCVKAFSSKFCLTEHQRTHTGEKSYQCSQCNKSFTSKSNFIAHQR